MALGNTNPTPARTAGTMCRRTRSTRTLPESTSATSDARGWECQVDAREERARAPRRHVEPEQRGVAVEVERPGRPARPVSATQ
jgi:hypothetical protein